MFLKGKARIEAAIASLTKMVAELSRGAEECNDKIEDLEEHRRILEKSAVELRDVSQMATKVAARFRELLEVEE